MRRNNFEVKRKKLDNIVFGRQPVLELLNTNKTIDKILLQNKIEGDIISEIKKVAAQKSIPIKYVPPEKLSGLTGGIHQGIIAFIAEIEFASLEDILPFIIEQGRNPLFVILDGITDVRNFGAIARTAYASGADAIIIPWQDAAPVNAEAMKTSAGALAKIPVCREKNFSEMFEYLKLNGIQIIGTDKQAKIISYDADFTIPIAIVMGNEETGLSGISRQYTNTMIQLPMMHAFNSYNVSVSAGMILYEVMKQRK